MDIGYSGALFGGLLTLLSPCSVMLLPSFFAYAFSSPGRLVGRTGLFYLGLAATLVPLGIAAGSLGALVTEHRTAVVTGAATLVILAGVVQLAGVPLPGWGRSEAGGTDRTSAAAVFLLGAAYAVAGTCAGPILGSVLIVAALGGSPAYGALLMALYALGMVVPLFVLAWAWQRFDGRVRRTVRPRTVRVGRWQNTGSMIVSGLVTIGIGVLLLRTDGTGSIGGLFTIGTQYRAESWVSQHAQRIPNTLFVLIAALALATVAALYAFRHRRPRPGDNGRTGVQLTGAGR